MSELVLRWYVRIFDMLSAKHKVELIALLAERLKKSFEDKGTDNEEQQRRESALDALIQSWENLEIDGDVIVGSRTITNRVYDL